MKKRLIKNKENNILAVIDDEFCEEYSYGFNNKDSLMVTSFYDINEQYHDIKIEEIFSEIIQPFTAECSMVIEIYSYNKNLKQFINKFSDCYIGNDGKSMFILRKNSESKDIVSFVNKEKIDEL